jgi:hypothetical protein
MCNSGVAKCICWFWRLKTKWNWSSHFQVLKLLTFCFINDHFLCSPLQEQCVEVVLGNEYAKSKVVEVKQLFVTPIKIQTHCHQSSSFFKVLTISILVFWGFYNIFYVFVIPNLLLLMFKFSSRYCRFRSFASSCFFFFLFEVSMFYKFLWPFFVCSSSIFKFSSNFWRFQYFVNLMIYFYLLSLMCHCPFVHCQFQFF